MILTKENYHTPEMNIKYMGSTQFKTFCCCEAKAMAELYGKWIHETSDDMLMGLYGHAWNDGTMEDFQINHPEMFSSRGPTKGELKAKFKKVEEIIELIQQDPYFMEAMRGEKEKIFTAEMFGCMWKIMIDNYLPSRTRFSDLKILKDLFGKVWAKEDERGVGIPAGWMSQYEASGYLRQVSIYAVVEAISAARLKLPPHETTETSLVKFPDEPRLLEPFLCVATKEKYPDKEIISFGSEECSYQEFIIRTINEEVAPRMKRINAVKAGKEKPIRCERCDYCKSTKKLSSTPVHFSAFDPYGGY